MAPLQSLLSYSDIQHFIAIKFCLLIFVVVALVSLYKHWRPLPLIIVTGILAGFSYWLLVDDLALMFWGLKGDEITIAAMYERFAHNSFWSDFAYPHLPPFYPPLWFWFFGFLGRLFDWHGIAIAKAASFATILLLPIGAYSLQAWLWGRYKNAGMPGRIAWIVSPFLLFIVLDWDALILKPYEVVAAVATILWSTRLIARILDSEWRSRDILLFGLAAGLIFQLYYLWLVFAAIAIALNGFFIDAKERHRWYSRLAGVAGVALVVATPYLLPLALTYAKAGSENWQTALMTLQGISWHLPFLDHFSIESAVMLFGVATLIRYSAVLYARTLLLLGLTAYIWHALGLATVFFFATPIQEFKGFDFWLPIVLAFAASFGIERLWQYMATMEKFKPWQTVLVSLGVVVAASQMIFGFFIDDPAVQVRRLESRQIRPALGELIDFLRSSSANSPLPLTLHSGIPELYAFVPMNTFIYFNQHNSHPAAHYFSRKDVVSALAQARSAEELHTLSRQTPFGQIGRFIFYRHDGASRYTLYFFEDDFPHGARERTISLSKMLFGEPWFTPVFENEEFIVWEPK